MKILMVGNSSSVKGGITTVINQIREYNWEDVGINMKFIPTYYGMNNPVKIIYFIISYIRILFSFTFWKPKYVHIHMSYKGSFTRANLIRKLADKFKIKSIIHLHGSEFEKWYISASEKKQNKIRELLNSSYKFIVLGKEWNKKIKSIEPNTKTVILNNTVKIPDYTVEYKPSEIIFLYMGVLIKRKGVSDLLDAISCCKSESKKIKLIIAGTGEEEKELKDKCKKMKLEEYVEFVGWVTGNEQKELYKTSNCMILPSYNEGLPMCILEAISYGIPVIATDVGDISSAVINNYNGYLVKPGDIKSITKAIKKFCTMNEKEYNTYITNSKKIAREKFSDTIFFEKLKEIYR